VFAASPGPAESARWRERLAPLRDSFRSALPYSHVVIDNFLPGPLASALAVEFPSEDAASWIHYTHVNEHKFGMRDRAQFGVATRMAIDDLNSDEFLAALSALTGIDGLLADPSLEGGGLHRTERDGFLNLHTDFTVHPHRANWRRRLNLLVYLNDPWDEHWGGELQMWDPSVRACVRRVVPVFNRAVLFDTDRAVHGHPDPLRTPENVSRRSLALYYYTDDAKDHASRATHYRARPGDGLRGVAIAADNAMLRVYGAAKRRLGIDDRWASALLGRIARTRRK